MSRRRSGFLLVGMVVLATILAGVVLSLKKDAQVAATQPFRSSFVARNWSFHLRRLGTDEAVAAAKAEEVWRDLLQRMAKDPATQALLKRLHADLPVEFMVVDAQAAADDAVMQATANEGVAITMRVADLSTKKEGGIEFRLMAYSRVIHVKNATIPVQSDPASGVADYAQRMKEEPLPGEPLGLAMEEYLVRHAPGWTSRGGPYFKDEKLPSSVAEQRQDLDQRIRDYADHASDFYGGLRKPL